MIVVFVKIVEILFINSCIEMKSFRELILIRNSKNSQNKSRPFRKYPLNFANS